MTVLEETVVLTDELYSALMNLAMAHNGKHEYDFCKVLPHHHYFILEPTGLIEIEHTDDALVRIARLTPAGWEYVGSYRQRRKRRRRSR